MKTLVCASVVVLVVLAGVQAQPPRGGHPMLMYFLSNSCKGIEETCRSNAQACLENNPREQIKTEEQLAAFKVKLNECATKIGETIDFSNLSLEDVQPPERGNAQRPRGPGGPGGFRGPPFLNAVSSQNRRAFMECMIEKEATFEALKSCLTGTTEA